MSAFDWHGGRITRRTPITKNYRNTQNVRRFFASQCGAAFKFDRPFMAWLKLGSGKTMGDAADEWLRRRHVRRARHDERGRISEIRFAVKENILGDPSRVTDADVTWFMENPGIWVWDEGGKVLGFAAADTRDGTIWALFIAPGHERRGIGRALFEKVCDVLRLDGHRTATLTTSPATRAEGFYRAAGWKVIGTSPRGELIFHSTL